MLGQHRVRFLSYATYILWRKHTPLRFATAVKNADNNHNAVHVIRHDNALGELGGFSIFSRSLILHEIAWNIMMWEMFPCHSFQLNSTVNHRSKILALFASFDAHSSTKYSVIVAMKLFLSATVERVMIMHYQPWNALKSHQSILVRLKVS